MFSRFLCLSSYQTTMFTKIKPGFPGIKRFFSNLVPMQRFTKNGLLAIEKSSGILANSLVTLVKKEILNNTPTGKKDLKVGHGGTLDKEAEGLMIIGLNSGCKALPKFLNGYKTYEVIGKLGIETDTLETVGEKRFEDKDPSHVTKEVIDAVLPKFTGKISQEAPIYSALKVDGKRMSDLVREGIEVKAKVREVEITELKLLDFNPKELTFTISATVGGGTYMRSLVRDIAIAVGSRASCQLIRRTRVGPFKLGDPKTFHSADLTMELINECLYELSPQQLAKLELQSPQKFKKKYDQFRYKQTKKIKPTE